MAGIHSKHTKSRKKCPTKTSTPTIDTNAFDRVDKGCVMHRRYWRHGSMLVGHGKTENNIKNGKFQSEKERPPTQKNGPSFFGGA